MVLYAPDYYPLFHCIADRCRHTCCAGWEIDIDEDSLKHYRSLTGPLAAELNRSISESDTPHFKLDEQERCPMLNEQNLCRLMLQYGEESLCQICRDHPRFRNYWTGRVEIGLGLVCEEAARIILSSSHPLRLIRLAGRDEPLPPKEAALMRFREKLLERVSGNGPSARLMEYLIYRHLADALYDGRLAERVAFIKEEHRDMMQQWKDGNLDTLVEIARNFSDETEYRSELLEAKIAGDWKKRRTKQKLCPQAALKGSD